MIQLAGGCLVDVGAISSISKQHAAETYFKVPSFMAVSLTIILLQKHARNLTQDDVETFRDFARDGQEAGKTPVKRCCKQCCKPDVVKYIKRLYILGIVYNWDYNKLHHIKFCNYKIN